MCGIAGVIRTPESMLSGDECRELMTSVLLHSLSRGKDSTGIAFLSDDSIKVCKAPVSAKYLVSSSTYRDMFARSQDRFAAIGHARMETDGSFAKAENNQPVVKDNVVSVHNGIVVNVENLWKDLFLQGCKRDYDVDTEAINCLLRRNLDKENNLIEAARAAFECLKGSFACAALFADLDLLLLATNTGSLYTLQDEARTLLAFASESRFLRLASQEPCFQDKRFAITQVVPGTAIIVNVCTLVQHQFVLAETAKEDVSTGRRQRVREIVEVPLPVKRVNEDRRIDNSKKAALVEKLIVEQYDRSVERIGKLRRCTRCILPETMPFITFDRDGVCSYCHNHQPRETRGWEALEAAIAPYRTKDGKPNCIVSFSGGRDSSFALHTVKNKLGLTPLAYSYDWGMLTDLGRRNQARMTGQLGTEHILISADIQQKRKYIRRNVLAWLKRPHIGIVPLFMAGDKQYFYYLNKLRKQTGIDLVIYGDNALEKTDFKYGFAGVQLRPEVGKAYDIGRLNSFKLLWFYFSEYAKNPRYLNSSLFDTFTAYASSYFVPKDYVYLFRYLLWDEKEIEKTLLEEYDWETSPDTKSTWRIGDGTASFYNYIYYIATGLTENDTFRSNQIREGAINREEALKKSEIDNRPRADSILWYCNTIGVDAEYAIRTINGMQKAYEN